MHPVCASQILLNRVSWASWCISSASLELTWIQRVSIGVASEKAVFQGKDAFFREEHDT